MSVNRSTLSRQIAVSFLIVFGIGFATLILSGQNALRTTNEAALARQERFAARHLEAAISDLPTQQQSATIWDDAVLNTAARDMKWMDANLGWWMQDYFGHNESYILDQNDKPIFASISKEVQAPESYASRASVIAPLVAQVRGDMADVSAGREAAPETLSEVAVVSPLRFGDDVAIVSVVPIVSDTGALMQAAGTEPLHVAVRYVDANLASEIGLPIELEGVAFSDTQPSGALAGVPLTRPSGEVLSWLVWERDRPGTDMFLNMLPVLLVVGLGSAALLLWIVRRLLRVSSELQAREAQARQDVVALKQAREAAEAADRAKMSFMSVVSHELRTPLTVIIGYARVGKNIQKMPSAQKFEEQLQRQPIDLTRIKDSVDEMLQIATTGMEKIDRSGEHLLFLVNQLLDYAKIGTGRLEVDPEICDVEKVLEPVVDQMRILIEQKGLQLETRITSCNMFADVIRTRQILINLMGNAIKFTDAGKISVLVAESEREIHIDVSDTGTGIATEEIEKIFEAFHQNDHSPSRRAAGTGLGLALAKELARLEGGSIRVHSEVGIGSTFTLSLPKRAPVAMAQAA